MMGWNHTDSKGEIIKQKVVVNQCTAALLKGQVNLTEGRCVNLVLLDSIELNCNLFIPWNNRKILEVWVFLCDGI